jgi:hypothetical protein
VRYELQEIGLPNLEKVIALNLPDM